MRRFLNKEFLIPLIIKVSNIKYIKLHAKKRIRKTHYLVESQVYLASTSLLLFPQSSLQQCFLWSGETLLPASAVQYDVLDPVAGVMTFLINRTLQRPTYNRMWHKDFQNICNNGWFITPQMNQRAEKGNRPTGRKVELFAFTAMRFNYTGQYDFSMIYFMMLLVLQTTQPQCLEHW